MVNLRLIAPDDITQIFSLVEDLGKLPRLRKTYQNPSINQKVISIPVFLLQQNELKG